VTAARTGDPIQGASLVLEVDGELRYGVVTDRNGFYQIGGIAAGDYVLCASAIGYADSEQVVTLPPGERVTISVRLQESALALEGVVVRTPGGGGVVRNMGMQRVTPRDLRRVPTPAGSGDLASYLQTMPGVVTTGDRGGHLFVRGGTAADNLILVDGMPIFQPFHIVGSFSVFPEDLVSGVDFHAGGFGARYSGRTSSVLDVQLRDGDRNGYRAVGSVGPFVAEALAEGPIGGGGVSWLLSARRSLVDETSEALLGERQPLTFDSRLLKVSMRGSDELRCSGLLVQTRDRGQIDPRDASSYVSWENLVAGGRCVVLFESALRLVEVNFSFSSVDNAAVSRGSSRFTSGLSRIQHDAHTTNMVGTVPVNAGYHITLDFMRSDLRELFGFTQRDDEISGMSAYVETQLPVGGRLEINPGTVVTLLPRIGIEPRLRVGFLPFGRDSGRLEGAVGLYRQDLVGTSDLRDVGSVFMAWMRAVDNAPAQAIHALLGWQQSHGEALHWSVEGYHKWLEDVPVPRWTAVTTFQTQLIRASGRAYGVDARIAIDLPRFYGFVGYGYGYIEYEATQREFGSWFGEPVQQFHPPHDRRHQVNAVGNLEIGAFNVAARWQFGSGLPYTPVLGFDEAFDYAYDLHEIGKELGTPRVVADRPFTGRLPVMHRLDVSVSRGFDLAFGALELQAGAINSYDRRNIFYYDLFTARRVDQLPIAPYAALTFRAPRVAGATGQ